jgi:hypothetical protein
MVLKEEAGKQNTEYRRKGASVDKGFMTCPALSLPNFAGLNIHC